jgi:hypothetical protein
MSMPSDPSGSGFQNRNQAMNEGINGAGAMPPAVPQSFLVSQAKLNSGGPAKLHYSGSGNGMAAGQAANTMSGMLTDTGNGSAANTYASKKWLEPRS